MLTLTDWAKLITDEKGRLQTLGAVEALSDARGWPLLKIMPFRPVGGQANVTNRATSSTRAATRAMNEDFEESSPGVQQYTFVMRAAGGDLKIDINMILGDTTGVLRAGLLTQKLRDIGARLFRMWFKGDRDHSSGAQWHGANEFCADNSLQTPAGENGGTITSDLLDDAIEKVPGANLILCNRTLARQINNLEIGVQKQVVLNQGGLSPDMFVQTYKGIPILPVGKAPNDTTGALEDILPFNETQGSCNTCSRVTVCRIGMDGIFGIHNRMLEIAEPRRAGAFEYNDMNWFMAGFATDYPDSIWQIVGVKAA
ncbi:MAG: hypothetical protein N3A38_16370 [Planctomycetota bacterium]|nr:hypothetical protein [Planctomycetota bacterium]